MNNLSMMLTGSRHQVYDVLSGGLHRCGIAGERSERDRGAVSLEQVLWFVAAGVSVAVIAAILWNQIRDEANTPVESPVAPNP
jgi:hypothetical protein